MAWVSGDAAMAAQAEEAAHDHDENNGDGDTCEAVVGVNGCGRQLMRQG
jgi:hypothetical protein